MGWGMNASNIPTSKLDKFTELDTVFKLRCQKRKVKDYRVVILISVFGTTVLFFFSTCQVL